jgi:hypothetical protein
VVRSVHAEDTSEVLFLLKQAECSSIVFRQMEKARHWDGGAGAVLERWPDRQGMQNTFAEAVEDCVLCVMSRTDVERMR